ncbi:single hybrid motif-containing protein [Fomes fomentarius]|nr:single hybrid motif-containing protein [Fomes fomentarius]
MQSLQHVSKTAFRSSTSRRWMHMTAARSAVSKLAMPAMSPTMTEGGIASWKKQEGEAFQVGDVLLEIETDKATIDVEAQDDGVLGKILAPDGTKNVPVGKTIALLAEDGDDISNLEVPADEPAPSQPTPQPSSSSSQPTSATEKKTPAPQDSSELHHPTSSRPLFPSVLRLVQEHAISQSDFDKIKGTGVRGMLTKGDVLAHLGLASAPTGTYRQTSPPDSKKDTKTAAKTEAVILDGPAVRRLIVANFLETSIKARSAAVPKEPADFDSVIADYLPPPKAKSGIPAQDVSKPKTADVLDGLL